MAAYSKLVPSVGSYNSPRSLVVITDQPPPSHCCIPCRDYDLIWFRLWCCGSFEWANGLVLKCRDGRQPSLLSRWGSLDFVGHVVCSSLPAIIFLCAVLVCSGVCRGLPTFLGVCVGVFVFVCVQACPAGNGKWTSQSTVIHLCWGNLEMIVDGSNDFRSSLTKWLLFNVQQ